MNELELLMKLLLDDACDASEDKASRNEKASEKPTEDCHKIVAKEIRKFYDACVDVGFSDEQAWEITLIWFKAASE